MLRQVILKVRWDVHLNGGFLFKILSNCLKTFLQPNSIIVALLRWSKILYDLQFILCFAYSFRGKRILFPVPKFAGQGSPRSNITKHGDIVFIDYCFLFFSLIAFNLFLPLIYEYIVVHIPAPGQYYGVNYFMCTAMLNL